MPWPSAQTVVTQAAIELGLIQSTSDWGDNVYASSDSIVAQLRALLKKAGRDLVDESDWSQLRQQFGILTQTAALAAAALPTAQATWNVYPLPPDFRAMVNQTAWNRSQRLPMGGASEQEWQYLSSRLAGLVLSVIFRPAAGLLYLYPANAAPAAQEIALTYKSSWWVQDVYSNGFVEKQWAPATSYNFGQVVGWVGAGLPFANLYYRCVRPGLSGAVGPDPAYATAPYVPKTTGALADGTVVWQYIGTKYNLDNPSSGIGEFQFNFGTTDIPAAGTDRLMFDEELLVSKLKLLWKQEKGFDTTDVELEYRRQFNQAYGNDSPAPILSLNGSGMVRDRMLSQLNIPITGFGS